MKGLNFAHGCKLIAYYYQPKRLMVFDKFKNERLFNTGFETMRKKL